ncbi:hypothetical protein CMUS01_07826 [Colletotrichum musicola]|uniref:Uncharacterized protein n=1 Tax=Colletotrichum musicola TaxID=2175873 RepID=A0A8H6KF82_9PEZI|nr:hypothetical protein CMUS01_07826 [Colletotrichum musicola]
MLVRWSRDCVGHKTSRGAASRFFTQWEDCLRPQHLACLCLLYRYSPFFSFHIVIFFFLPRHREVFRGQSQWSQVIQFPFR